MDSLMQGSKDDGRGKTWTRREKQTRSRSESRRTIPEGRGKNEESKDEREELEREAIKFRTTDLLLYCNNVCERPWARRRCQARSISEGQRTRAEGRGKKEESRDKAVAARRDGREKGQPLGETREERRE